MSSGEKFASSRRRASNRTRLSCEQLETREVPATLASIADYTTPNTKDFYVPLTVTNTTGTVTYTATSGNTQVQAQVVTGGTTIKFHVTGTAADNTAFSGDLTLRLFDTLAPTTSARIVSLINSGFYNNLTFHRILAGFVAQGGDPNGNGTGGSGTKLNDEITTQLSFNSPGLLAMANSGPDSSDSQFFITAPATSPTTTLQSLNFRYTIFGQLVSGFDTFDKLIHTPVTGSNGSPTHPVTITSASVVSNDQNGVLRITAPATFTGTSAITVTPSDGGASSTGDTFNVTFTQDTINDAPFLGTILDQTTTLGTGVTFKLTATDLENDTLTYSVVSAKTPGGEPVPVTSKIDQKTGLVTVTPPDNFSGTIKLTLGVKDATSTVDTQVINLTVTGSFDLNTVADTGTLTDDNITSLNTPSLTVLAPTGRVVTVSVNGVAAGTATEDASTGRYRLSLPANRLVVGPNTITGTATNAATGGTTTLTPFTLTYLPTLKNFYVVPGAIGSTQQVTFQFTSKETISTSEFGFYTADDATGKIGSLTPGAAGYAAAALARRQMVFAAGTAVGTSVNMTVKGGDVLVMYLVQGTTSAKLLADNPTNAFTPGKPIAFFGITAANPDGVAHVSTASDPGDSQALVGFEDGNSGGDKDYNDVVVNIRKLGDTQSAALVVPGAAGRGVTLTSTVKLPVKAQPLGTGVGAPQTGEIGVIVADDATGKIGTLTPGSAGYAAAALARAQILFASGALTGASTTTTLTAGQNLIFYFVPGGTAANVIADNPTNSTTGSKIAFFSLAAANPDGVAHARNFQPEKVTQVAPTPTDPLTVHMMGKVNGGVADFDDVAFTVGFGA